VLVILMVEVTPGIGPVYLEMNMQISNRLCYPIGSS
jgi:hypothetical protein